MNYGFFILLILGGLIAMSSLIAVKRPDAAAVIGRLVPFQGLIGLAMIVMSIVFLVKLGPGTVFGSLKTAAFGGLLTLIQILAGIILGTVLLIPMLAKMGGNEPRAQQLTAQLLPYISFLGMAAALSGLGGILYALGIAQRFVGT